MKVPPPLMLVAKRLGPLRDRVVFVGGMIRGLLVTDPAAVTNTTDGPLRHLEAPRFCATKLEAFASRADGDLLHHDLEDFIAVVDERQSLGDEISNAPEEARLPMLMSRLERIAALRGNASTTPPPTLYPPPVAPHATLPTRTPPGARELPPAQRGPLERVPLRSSNLRAATYDPTTTTLVIEFHGGRRYEYSGVPSTVYQGLLRAYSHGRYFYT